MNAIIRPLILLCLPLASSFQSIFLNTSNVITIRDSIDDDTATRFIYDLNQKKNKTDVFVYLDTPGGSVESGSKILMEIQKYNLSCIADRAYSMGFVILQGCKNRYIRPYGRIMQHQISYAVKNEKAKVDNYVHFIDQIEDELVAMQADRIGMDHNEFRLKTMNDWWMVGRYALNNKCVDEIVDVYCDEKLTRQNMTIEFGPAVLIYSKCPLIPEYIDSYIEKKKK
jgi:ATP-dependent protease ClpP protease subunit